MRWLITLEVVCLASVSASDVVNAPQITSTQTTRTIENFPEWLQYVSPFQTAIAALLGFVGVIITIIVNGFLARRLEKFKFNQERQGVASALRAELEIISRQIDVYIRNLPMATDITAFPIPILKDVDNFGLIFNALTAKLGYLE